MALNRIRRPWEINKDNNISQGRKVITKFYHSKVWRHTRRIFLNSKSSHLPGLENHINKFCWICALSNKYTLTHTIDHIKPINRKEPYNKKSGEYGDPLDFINLAPLCERHTSKKNAYEKHGKILSLEEQAIKLKDIDY